MPKPPPSPPSSDIGGVDRDRVSRRADVVIDEKAQAELAAHNEEEVGRPDQDRADQPKDDPNVGVGD